MGRRPATPEFFEILGIEIVTGRGFTTEDDRGEPVVVVNETMAHHVWPGEQAIGKRIRIGFDPSFDRFSATSAPPTPSAAAPCRRVVGVAGDVRQRSVVPIDNEAALMQYYVPSSQAPGPPAGMGPMPQASGLLLRTTGDPRPLIDPIRRIVVDGSSVLPYLQTLEGQVRPWRMGVTLLGLFSVVAIGIAAIGLYAAFAHAVSQRIREIAIRMAVGATRERVVAMVLIERCGSPASALSPVRSAPSSEAALWNRFCTASFPLIRSS